MLLTICALRRSRLRLGARNLRDCSVIALLGTAIPATMYFYAVPHVPVGVLAITVALVPMLTYALSWSIGIDRFGASAPAEQLAEQFGFTGEAVAARITEWLASAG